jgi:hypothetical protein
MTRIDELFHKTREETDLSDPTEIAEMVDKQLTARERRELFPLLLRRYIVGKLTRERTSGQGGDDTQSRTAGRHPTVGKRVKAIRETAWAKELRVSEFVGNGLWIPLADCGPTELDFIAANRRRDAARYTARAERYAKLAEALRKAHKNKLSDFSEDPLS